VAVYFLNMKTFGRANGSSAISAIAYRSGERIRDERTGRIHDHSGRAGVINKEIVLPGKLADTDLSWAKDRATLWNAVEAAESRSNARVAREFLVALPAELTPEQRLGLVRDYSRELVERYQFALDFAIHEPRTDPRNYHAHLLATTREINSAGFGAKTTLELNDTNRMHRGLPPFFQELAETRARWANMANAALRDAQLPVRVDHRSLAAQGIDREPGLRLPRAIYEMERRGERNDLAERLRAEHETRVQERLERAAAQLAPVALPLVPAARPIANGERAAIPAAQSLEETRRQARENWLRLRQAQAAPAPTAGDAARTRDDDLSR
jgi:ATP-dependent exoDNAse (exonuclease V) alpha subunit